MFSSYQIHLVSFRILTPNKFTFSLLDRRPFPLSLTASPQNQNQFPSARNAHAWEVIVRFRIGMFFIFEWANSNSEERELVSLLFCFHFFSISLLSCPAGSASQRSSRESRGGEGLLLLLAGWALLLVGRVCLRAAVNVLCLRRNGSVRRKPMQAATQ
jgi:hypothetical protein